MSKKVCVFLADGFEEIEGLTVVDLLRRVGAEVTCASIMGEKMIHGAHGIDVMADVLFEEVDYSKQDMVVLPGGLPGTTYLSRHEGVCEVVQKFDEEKKYIAAICAAPTVFSQLGLLEDRDATCYPSMSDDIRCGRYVAESVVVSDHIITSRGLGTAIDFALKLIELLYDAETATQLARGIVYQ